MQSVYIKWCHLFVIVSTQLCLGKGGTMIKTNTYNIRGSVYDMIDM